MIRFWHFIGNIVQIMCAVAILQAVEHGIKALHRDQLCDCIIHYVFAVLSVGTWIIVQGFLREDEKELERQLKAAGKDDQASSWQ